MDDDVNVDDADTGDSASSVVGVFPLNIRTNKAKTHLEMQVSGRKPYYRGCSVCSVSAIPMNLGA